MISSCWQSLFTRKTCWLRYVEPNCAKQRQNRTLPVNKFVGILEAQPHIHTLTLFLLGSLGYLMLRWFQVGRVGALVRNIMAQSLRQLFSVVREYLRVPL